MASCFRLWNLVIYFLSNRLRKHQYQSESLGRCFQCLETPGPLGSSNAITITLTGPLYSVFNASYPAGTPDYFHMRRYWTWYLKFRSTILATLPGSDIIKSYQRRRSAYRPSLGGDGTLLATEPFVNETTSGWRSVPVYWIARLLSPLANTIISFLLCSFGEIFFTNPFFNRTVLNGPLRGLANGKMEAMVGKITRVQDSQH